MFETVIAAMLKHKQLVLAAIVVTALSGMVVQPIIPVAQAQLGSDIASDVLDSVFGGDDDEAAAEDEEEAGDTQGDDNQNIDQTAEQENEQEQEAEQEVEQNNDQSETNVQANELDTGDNTATVTQANAAEQDVDASADAAAAAEAESEAESEDDGSGDNYSHGKKKKHHDSDHHYSGSYESDSDSTSSVADAEAIADAAAEATGIQEQNNTADVDQDSSIHDVDLSSNVLFGDDTNDQTAIPITDQDQRAANLAEQQAANLDIEIITEQIPTPPTTPTPPDDGGVPPPEEDGVFCLQTLSGQIFCFDTSEACETAEGLVIVQTGCEEFETPPAGAISCSIVEGKIECEV